MMLRQRQSRGKAAATPNTSLTSARTGSSWHRAATQAKTAVAPPIVHEVLQSPGLSLDSSTRASMESRFGHDFSRVRVHADRKAAESAEAVNARAYTVGRDVVFGAGQYAPGINTGRSLIAHELIHTLQQRDADHASNSLGIGPSDTLHEQEAETMAGSLAVGQPIHSRNRSCTSAALQVQRFGFGEVRVEEGRMEEEERIRGGCPLRAQAGTLSEVSWGETAGLYPTAENKFEPEKWNPAKTCELLRTRAAIDMVAKRGEKVNRSKPSSGAIDQKLKPYHLVENFLSTDTEVRDAGVRWFYLSSESDKPAVHPSKPGSEVVKTYGSFYNIGGGDVAVGDTYIHFYRVKPAAVEEAPKP